MLIAVCTVVGHAHFSGLFFGCSDKPETSDRLRAAIPERRQDPTERLNLPLMSAQFTSWLCEPL